MIHVGQCDKVITGLNLTSAAIWKGSSYTAHFKDIRFARTFPSELALNDALASLSLCKPVGSVSREEVDSQKRLHVPSGMIIEKFVETESSDGTTIIGTYTLKRK